MFVTLALQSMVLMFPAPRDPVDTRPGYLGIVFQAAEGGGLLVTEVRDKSPAKEYGLQVGDVLLKYDGLVIPGTDPFVKFIVDTRPKSLIPIEIRRGDKKLTVKVLISERPEDFPTNINIGGTIQPGRMILPAPNVP